MSKEPNKLHVSIFLLAIEMTLCIIVILATYGLAIFFVDFVLRLGVSTMGILD